MAVTGQFAIAQEATFTYTAGSGAESLTVFKVGFSEAAWQEGRRQHLAVPVGYVMERYLQGILWVRCALGGLVDKSGAGAPTPGGTTNPPLNPGTLLVTFATGRTKTATGFLTELNWLFAGGGAGGPQKYQYLFVGSAENTTGTITTA